LRRRGAQIIPLDGLGDIEFAQMEAVMEHKPDERPDRMAMRAQVRQLIEAGIDQLPDVFRTVFMLRAVEELSVEEVAVALNIPEATVRSRFFRARGLLREGLARDIDVSMADAFAFAGVRCDRIVARVLADISGQIPPLSQ
jgi:RNA polymerase sigma-70 factor (ECF subfamily)